MPIQLPQLDNRTYAEMVDEARSYISSISPEWTDHNPSDPGIVLIEMFAWLTEMLIYQPNRVTDANKQMFLRLLNGPSWTFEGDLDQAIGATVLELRSRFRAVSADDYEFLAVESWPDTPEARAMEDAGKGRIRRAHCVPVRNLAEVDAELRRQRAPSHISLVVVSDTPDDAPLLDDDLGQALWDYLDERRLLTVRHHVVAAEFVPLRITAKIFLREDASAPAVKARAAAAMAGFFHPLSGGLAGDGWPFGRSAYVSDVYRALDDLTGVRHVTGLRLITPDPTRRELTRDGDLVGITLDDHELFALDVNADSFETEEFS